LTFTLKEVNGQADNNNVPGLVGDFLLRNASAGVAIQTQHTVIIRGQQKMKPEARPVFQ
jgi:hypothetical protein